MNNISHRAMLWMASFSLAFCACSHQTATERKVEQEIRNEPAVSAGGRLAYESRKLIESSEELTVEQKQKLIGLHARMAEEVSGMREEEGKMKMVLFKTLLNPRSSEAEIANIKNKILKLDRKRTNRMLSALEEARDILGRKVFSDDGIYRAFVGEPYAGHGDF